MCRYRQKAREADVHAPPDTRAGEGIPLQPVPHAPAAGGGGARGLSDGAADQDLVPEPADEVEEGESGDGRRLPDGRITDDWR